MNDYLNDVLEAIQRVDVHYFKWNDYQDKTELEKEMLEHVFCYEFYHQFRKIMECKNSKYHDLRLNGEIKKIIAEGYQNKIEKNRFPDFILHEAQDTKNMQELVIEVKTVDNISPCKFLYDLLKIDAMISQLEFKAGLFIAVNMDNEMLRSKIATALENNDIKIKNRCKIYFMATASVRDEKCQEKFFMLNEQN